MNAPVVAERVSLQVRNRWLVRDVSMTVEPGEVVALVGPNGAGKSSLLRMLAGDAPPTNGRISIDGRVVGDYRPRELALARAVLPQQTVLQFGFTVREVVEMGRGPRGGGPGDTVVIDCLRRTDTLHLADRIYPSLSGGEQARVTLARVLAQQTHVLLLDEPTAALDLHHQQLVMDIARELANDGASVLVILHDLNLAAANADRIGVMRDGYLVKIGTPWETMKQELLSDVFSCPITVAPHPTRSCPLVIPLASQPLLAVG
jgi:iron complex transport system ATP-binding protein